MDEYVDSFRENSAAPQIPAKHTETSAITLFSKNTNITNSVFSLQAIMPKRRGSIFDNEDQTLDYRRDYAPVRRIAQACINCRCVCSGRRSEIIADYEQTEKGPLYR